MTLYGMTFRILNNSIFFGQLELWMSGMHGKHLVQDSTDKRLEYQL